MSDVCRLIFFAIPEWGCFGYCPDIPFTLLEENCSIVQGYDECWNAAVVAQTPAGFDLSAVFDEWDGHDNVTWIGCARITRASECQGSILLFDLPLHLGIPLALERQTTQMLFHNHSLCSADTFSPTTCTSPGSTRTPTGANTRLALPRRRRRALSG